MRTPSRVAFNSVFTTREDLFAMPELLFATRTPFHVATEALNATPERLFATWEVLFATRTPSRVAFERLAPPREGLFATSRHSFAMPTALGVARNSVAAPATASRVAYFPVFATPRPVGVLPFGLRIIREPMEEAAVATGPMSLQEIIVSLEAQAAHHREQLELITRRLEELRTATSAATELAEGVRSRLVEPDARLDIGPPAKPHLARMAREVLTEIAPGRPFGPNWVTQEVNRRFGSRLKHPVEVPQISAVLRRMERLGELRRHKSGGARHETQYVKVG